MIHLLESFGCGLCFALGATFGTVVTLFAVGATNRTVQKELRESNQRIEERVGVYVQAMSEILEEVKKK